MNTNSILSFYSSDPTINPIILNQGNKQCLVSTEELIPWSETNINQLKNLVKQYREDWEWIGSLLTPARQASDCLTMWQTIQNTNSISQKRSKNYWTEEQDEALKNLVSSLLHSPISWEKVAKKINEIFHTNFSGKNCAYRWHNHVNPTLNLNDWTDEEYTLIQDYLDKGYKWKKIGELIHRGPDLLEKFFKARSKKLTESTELKSNKRKTVYNYPSSNAKKIKNKSQAATIETSNQDSEKPDSSSPYQIQNPLKNHSSIGRAVISTQEESHQELVLNFNTQSLSETITPISTSQELLQIPIPIEQQSTPSYSNPIFTQPTSTDGLPRLINFACTEEEIRLIQLLRANKVYVQQIPSSSSFPFHENASTAFSPLPSQHILPPNNDGTYLNFLNLEE